MEHKLHPLWTTSNFRKQIQPWYYLPSRNELQKESPVYTKTFQYLRQKPGKRKPRQRRGDHCNFKYDSTEIPLNSNLKAVAISILFPKRIHICNIYIPNNFPLNLQDLEELIAQIHWSCPKILTAISLNALWGLTRTDRGKKIENRLNNQDLILLNTGSNPTYFSIRNCKTSAIDLTFLSPELVQHLEWETLKIYTTVTTSP